MTSLVRQSDIAEIQTARIAELEAKLVGANGEIVYLAEQRNRLQQKIGGQKEAIRRAEAAATRRKHEIHRHHADFERWEAMADKGAAQIEANRIYSDALDQIGELSSYEGDTAAQIAFAAQDAVGQLRPKVS